MVLKLLTLGITLLFFSPQPALLDTELARREQDDPQYLGQGKTSHLLQAGASQAGSESAPRVAPWARRGDGTIISEHDEHAVPASPPPAGLYVAMGDSITFGNGVTKNCAVFPIHPVDIDEYCPDGKSYAILVAKALRKAGIAGKFMNLGIPGAKVERILNDELPYLPSNATFVTIYIGTNDSRDVLDLKVPISAVVDRYKQDYLKLLGEIKTKAPQARVVLVNIPNEREIASTYHIPEAVLPRYDATSQLIDKFIDELFPAFTIVDTICDPKSYIVAHRYKGTVHPTDAGAADLAAAIIATSVQNPSPEPPLHCQWFDAASANELRGRP